MQLTLFTDYSLRLLLFLGANPERLVSVPEVAQSYGISQHHLVKVAHFLTQRGLVESVRGRGGGMRLAKEPQEISLGKVVRETEPGMQLLECFDPAKNTCPIAAACELKGIFYEAQQQFLAVLDRYTLADLLLRQGELRRLWKKP